MAMTSPEWFADAECRHHDPELWLAGERDVSDEVARPAITICRRDCPVRTACLTHAIERDEDHGVWGGMTPRQRQSLGKQDVAPPSPPEVPKEARDQTIVALTREGMSLRQIAQQVGMSPRGVSHVRRRQRIKEAS